ncbi:helix-turn-helix DNA binding domain protein [Streptomyces phage Galactica]|nr:helix-turn-helix DNA binding domain protein [Streptomyces phage Galactica]
MGSPRTTPKVLAALNAHRGLDVPLDTLVRETGLTEAQVQTSVRNLINREKLPITVVVKAQVWRYEAANQVAKPKDDGDTMFELVGKTRSGVQIVRGDQTETLYTLEPLDFE